jgi:hypothetical protein
MSFPRRPFLSVAVLLLLALVLYLPGRWALPYLREALSLPWYLSDLHSATRLGEDLDQQADVNNVRDLGQLAAVDDLIAGRCTLLEAAARFRDLAEAASNFPWEEFRRHYPGANDEERHCQRVIEHLQARLEKQPDRCRALVRRLEAELDAYRACGPLRLPPAARLAVPPSEPPVASAALDQAGDGPALDDGQGAVLQVGEGGVRVDAEQAVDRGQQVRG